MVLKGNVKPVTTFKKILREAREILGTDTAPASSWKHSFAAVEYTAAANAADDVKGVVKISKGVFRYDFTEMYEGITSVLETTTDPGERGCAMAQGGYMRQIELNHPDFQYTILDANKLSMNRVAKTGQAYSDNSDCDEDKDNEIVDGKILRHVLVDSDLLMYQGSTRDRYDNSTVVHCNEQGVQRVNQIQGI